MSTPLIRACASGALAISAAWIAARLDAAGRPGDDETGSMAATGASPANAAHAADHPRISALQARTATARIALATTAGCAVTLGCCPTGPATFTPIPDLPGGADSTFAWGISPDGSVVVGASSSTSSTGTYFEAFTWKAVTGTVGLGDLAGSVVNSAARAVSTNGAAVIGGGVKEIFPYCDSAVPFAYNEAFRRTAAGMTGLGNLGYLSQFPPPCWPPFSYAYGVSATGQVVVGKASYHDPGPPPGPTGLYKAFRWDSVGGLVGMSPPIGPVNVWGVSADGSVIIGDFWFGPEPFHTHAAIFVGDDIMPTDLGDLPGGSDLSSANAASADGSVIVGSSSSTNSGGSLREAFRWTSAGGMVGLGDLPGGVFHSVANGVSADGCIVVGSSRIDSFPTPFGAFIWDKVHGMRNLRDVLVTEHGLGAVLQGWDLNFATGVSADGRSIVGYDVASNGNAHAWLVRLPVPHPADINCDGTVNIADLLSLLAAWGGCPAPPAPCPADLNGDGTVNITDLLALLGAWGDCPGPAPGVCCYGNCNYALSDTAGCNAAGGTFFPGFDLADADADRLPDDFERDDCDNSDPCYAGTDPNMADTDSDGILDGDEKCGTILELDLPALGANPCHRDIFLETDWIWSGAQDHDRNKLHANQRARVVAAFANAPLPNPDGAPGINIHIDTGQAPLNGGNAVQDPSNDDAVNVASADAVDDEFLTIKNANFAANRHGYFHYGLLCDNYSIAGVTSASSGLAELPGDDLIDAMGSAQTGDHNSIGNTLMHELGHNLGLRHGGNIDRNFKPNYNSIMNYWYQACGVDTNDDVVPDGALDYSRGEHPALDEDALNEPDGVTGNGPAINWNGDADATDLNVQRNINCRLTNNIMGSNCAGPFNQQHAPCSNNNGGLCDDSTCDLLTDFDDWVNLMLNTLNDADLAPIREIVHCWLDGQHRSEE